MDPQTLHGEKLGSVEGLQSQWWGSRSRRIPGACCLACGPVGELQDDEERDLVSREQPKKTPEVNLRVSHAHMHKKQVSKEEWGHFCGRAGVRDNPSMPVGEAVVRAEGEYRPESTKAWAKCVRGGWTTHDATTSGCPRGLPSNGAFRLQKAYQSHSLE